MSKTIQLTRHGDFYEAHGGDADLLAKSLHLTLQVRIDKDDNRTAVCGFPAHAAERFGARLAGMGIEVRILEGEKL